MNGLGTPLGAGFGSADRIVLRRDDCPPERAQSKARTKTGAFQAATWTCVPAAATASLISGGNGWSVNNA
jgi:hypothetical protein